MRKISALVLTACMVLTAAITVGCKKNIPDTEETLEVFVLEAGYGSQWAKDMLGLFEQQAWVKTKYPNLEILFRANDVTTYAESRLNAGAKSNTIDLIFGTMLHNYAGANGDLEDLTESVYNSIVPGEEILWKDKALASYNQSNRYIDVTNLEGEPRYFTTSWAGGMNSILYNEDILTSFGFTAPNTTDEFLAICQAIAENKDKDNGKYNNGYSILQSKEADVYWSYPHDVWWAQFEGVDNYLNFWNGIDDNRYSNNIFKQQGRLETLKVYESILKYNNGYWDPATKTHTFMVAQKLFLQGEAVFHVNGDWFDNEMRSSVLDIIENKGKIDTFKTMKMPIISALGTKLGINDKTLSAIVDYVDSNIESAPEFESTKGYSKNEVIESVRQARTIVHSIGPSHTAVIPSYSNGKEVAIDFLRFMATDVANESYIKSTGGASLPFHYNLKEKNLDIYNNLSDLQKSRHDYFNNPNYEIYTLPSSTSFPLARYGQLVRNVKENYYDEFTTNGSTKTADDFFNETIEVWDNNKFRKALSDAGIAA